MRLDQLDETAQTPGEEHPLGARALPRFAAVDLGTNNCRLLVAEPRADGFKVVASFSRVTRLGEGLTCASGLSEAAMNRTLNALGACRRQMRRSGVMLARCVATEACRRADNGLQFLKRVRQVTGLRFEVLDHAEEARLALLGCAPLFDKNARHLLMVDIGGGSTEVLWLDRANPEGLHAGGNVVSLPLGVVTLSESFGRRLGTDRYDDAVRYVKEKLRSASNGRRFDPGPGERVQMLGTSGTVTTLAAVHMGLKRYDRRKVDGVSLPYAAIAEAALRLRRLDESQRAAHPCAGGERAELVLAGCAILDAVHDAFPVSWLRVADRGVREGILNDLMGLSLDKALAADA